jgi:DNA replication and repair protein RecF
MRLQHLSLIQYKNNEQSQLNFSDRINIFVGDNGAGKTNILDAIYYLSFCKSPFRVNDSQNILHDKSFFTITGEYLTSENSLEKVLVNYENGGKKHFKRNDKEYERLADHIGEFPLVIISPADSILINGSSEERRKYIDSVISQFDKAYLQTLLHYNKIIQQRNALLKTLHDQPQVDKTIIEALNSKLNQYGTIIFEKRKAFLEDFIPLIQVYYQFISNEKEIANVSYRSQLHTNPLSKLLVEHFNKELILKYTTVGIHRDDIEFEINGFPIRSYGSQGQQKSFLIALKIAQFEYTYKMKKYKPLLLLDDIFDKLDYHRVKQLMKLVSRNEFGQIFISDTNQERIEHVFAQIEVDKRIFEVIKGKVQAI